MATRKLRFTAELEYDAEIMHSGDADPEAKTWFLGLLKGNGDLCLHENDEIGDTIGPLRIVSEIEEVKT